MQLKRIRIRGQCRGHPPIRGSGRDGPGSSEFKVQSSKFELFEPLVNLSVLSALVVKRRWGETVISLQSAVWNLEFGIWNLEFGIPDPGPIRFRSSRARDWINFTCSLSFNIIKDRHKHRWGATFGPARGGRRGKLCLGDWGIGRLGDWMIG
jgi:hypothetical protein